MIGGRARFERERLHTRALGLLVVLATFAAACSGGGSAKVDAGASARVALKDPTGAASSEWSSWIGLSGIRKALGKRADDVLVLVGRAQSAYLAKLPPLAGAALPASSEPTAGSTTVPGASTGSAAPPAVGPPAAQFTAVDIVMLGELFRGVFEEELDPATAGGLPAGGADFPLPSDSATTSAAGASATVSGSGSLHVQGSGSVVTARLDVSEHTVVTDAASGTTLADISTELVMTGLIDVCPSANGTSAGSLETHFTLSSNKAAAAGSSGLNATMDFDGAGTLSAHVDDQANLIGVDQDFHYTEHKQSQSNGVTADGAATMDTASSWPASGTLDAHTTSQSTAGSAGDPDLSAAATTSALSIIRMDMVYQAAQKLWRNGRCVVVTVPAYSAETPIKIADQGASQHTEKVGTGSRTKFTVQLRHRFGSPPRAPIDAAITSGQVKLDPLHLDGLPGSLTYTAPNDPGKTATVDLKSTSRRGIGRLVIEFETKPKDLQLSINGTLTTGISLVQIRATVSVGPVTLKKTGDDTWEGDATLKDSYTAVSLPIPCAALGNESGSIHLTASRQTQGDTSVWVVHPDPSRSHVSGQFTCVVPVRGAFSGGSGYGVKFMAAVGDITIPDAGGTVPVNASRPLVAGVTDVVTGTIVATVTDGG